MGATPAEIDRVLALGFEGWLNEQMAMPQVGSRWSWLVANGYGTEANRTTQAGADGMLWHHLLSAPDTLRQRVALALSEIFVVSIDGLSGAAGYVQFGAAAYMDLLEKHSFGQYRELIEGISTSPAMGVYLTFRNNLKANANGSNQPDENYARELLQLFSIGLVKLKADGTPDLLNAQVQETYSNEDIMGLARVFTGWVFDNSANAAAAYNFQGRPMVQQASRHELGSKSFLGVTVPANTDGVASLKIALDTLLKHPNTAPFISRQLIQRLVTSNPSPGYVQRVAAAFTDNGKGVKGDFKAVVKAVLLDTEARELPTAATAGKLREPILRLAQWARAGKASSQSGLWGLGNASDPATRLGQSPLRAPSVFNFFRPGYVPPGSSLASQGLVAPEFQITNESTVLGYVNVMQALVSGTAGTASDVRADDQVWLPLANDSAALLAALNEVLAAGQISGATLAVMKSAIETLSPSTEAGAKARIWAAQVLVLSCPEFLILK
jgi:uncharacterized protein (DUF1800 family)